jgi:hypothetical protein
MTRDRKDIRDLTASIRQRLLNLAKARGEDFQATLTRYALERLLYRLSVSRHRDDFVLKGAMLFAAWTGNPHWWPSSRTSSGLSSRMMRSTSNHRSAVSSFVKTSGTAAFACTCKPGLAMPVFSFRSTSASGMQ